MTDLLLIASAVGALAAAAGMLAANLMAGNRAKYLAERRSHPAE
jgi:hypothetical protein